MNKQYEKVIQEHFDICDRETRKVLLSINEADQDQVLTSLAAKLYKAIVKKVPDIDYGKIPESKGDITKIPNFQDIQDTLSTVRDLMIHFKQSTDPVDTIVTAIANLKDSSRLWEKAYNIEAEIPILTYNNIALAIVSSTSLMVSASVEFIKEPSTGNYQLFLDKMSISKSKDCLLFKNLDKFNKAYKKGDIEKCISGLLKADKTVKESGCIDEAAVTAVIGTVLGATKVVGTALFVLLLILLPILHEIVNFLYCTKQSISDYFAVQADILQLNAENLKYDYAKSEDAKKAIFEKQTKIAKNFKKISNKLAVKIKKTEIEAGKMTREENNTKFKIGEVVPTMPDSASSIF